MKHICIVGRTSAIGDAVIDLIPERYPGAYFARTTGIDDVPLNYDEYVICTGYLESKCVKDMFPSDAHMHFSVNYYKVVRVIELILNANADAKICVLGSESGFKGSYNEVYAGMKAALHQYVETRKVRRHQHLVCVAPTIVANTKMTEERPDYEEVMRRGKHTRLGRWLSPHDVARAILYMLSEPFTCNTVLRMHGGIQ